MSEANDGEVRCEERGDLQTADQKGQRTNEPKLMRGTYFASTSA